MKIYEVRHFCGSKISVVTTDTVNALGFCKKCHRNFLIPPIGKYKDFKFIESREEIIMPVEKKVAI